MDNRFLQDVKTWTGMLQNTMAEALKNDPESFCFVCFSDHKTKSELDKHFAYTHIRNNFFFMKPWNGSPPVICWFCSNIFPTMPDLTTHLKLGHGLYMDVDPKLFPIINEWFGNELTPVEDPSVVGSKKCRKRKISPKVQKKSICKPPFIKVDVKIVEVGSIKLACGYGCDFENGKLNIVAEHYRDKHGHQGKK